MAMSSNRSPSPLSTRPANPNLRSSESNSTIRRSFSGNPFARPSVLTNPRSFIPDTPANSPADFGRKQIGGKEGVSRCLEEKENDKDSNSKGIKFKSSSKGSKNFMSPTISAASKFTPSPRKKILGERNESIRTSISFDDGKEASVEDFDSKSAMGVDQNKAEGSNDPNLADFDKKEMGVDQNKAEGSNDPNLADFDKKEVVLEVPPVPKASKAVTFSEVPLNSHKDSESLSEISSNSDCIILGVPLVHKTLKGDTFSPVLLNSLNDSESLSVMTMNSDCVNAESISNNMFYSPSISPVLAPPEVPLIPKASNGHTFSQVPFNSHNKLETVSGVTMNSYFINAESSFKNKTYSSPVIAPLDADPSFPPYDPQTNYLSPRPKFLRYKPNPRIEVFLNKEKGPDFELGKGLEESLVISDTSSDTGVTEENHSQDPQKESEDGSSSDMIASEEEQEEPLVSEPIPISYPISNHLPEKTFEVKRASKPQLFTGSKCISLVLVLLIACVSISVTDVPVLDLPVFKDSSFYKLFDSSEVAMFAKENFDGFARTLMLCSSQTIPYLSKIIPHLGEVDHLGTLQFSNLTILEEHSLVDGLLRVNLNSEKIEEIYEEDEFESVEEGKAEMGPLEEKTDSEVVVEHNEGESGHGGSEVELLMRIQVEVNGSESSEEIVDHEQSDTTAHIDAEPQSNIDDQLVLTSQDPENRPTIVPFEINQEVVTSLEFQVDNDVTSAKIESSVADENPAFSTAMDVSEIVGSPIYVIEDKLFARVLLGISSLVLAIVTAVTTFTYVKQGKNNTTPNNVVHVDPVLSKRIISSPISAEHIYQDRPFSQNWPTEFEVGESSYPSEMSSFQKSSSKGAFKETNKAQSQERKPSKGAFKETNKAQSQERKPRKNSKRESLASSDYSMGSPSYGSFTTYEKIPIKHASGDEEIVTPVRRSSRIRSQVISP